MPVAELKRLPIRQLPTQLANQIAAGEVVERPASIVKELIENSIDAGASYLEIDIEKGGLELIRIRDNGCGIPKQEIPLAVQAHCTSKISNFNDLCAIESMGFRGEALASIVSISRFEIISATVGEENAWCWRSENSADSSSGTENLVPASHPHGTSIIVRDIFYNTVARRKFLRSERTEFRHIEDVVKRIALSRFDIEIVLKHNQRVVHRLLPAITDELKIKRLEKLLDKKFIQSAVQVFYQASQLTMTGWLSNKDYSRGQTDMQYFYVNGRMVKDKVISHALRQVYQAMLPPGRFPAYVLNLQIDPQQVDVNVHPTKHEVRFRQTRLVHDFVNHVIEYSLAETGATAANTGHTLPGYDKTDNAVELVENRPGQQFYARPSLQDAATSYRASPSAACSAVKDARVKDVTGSRSNFLGEAIGFCAPYYLLAQAETGMVLVHLLRVEHYKTEQKWLTQYKQQQYTIKPFIFPLNIELDVLLCDCIDVYAELISSLGFELGRQNKTTVLLRAAPDFLQYGDHKALIRQLLTSLQMENNITAEELICLLSRFVQLDSDSHLKSITRWNEYLRDLESVFSALHKELPYKNKFWRLMSVNEINKLFQMNVAKALQPG